MSRFNNGELNPAESVMGSELTRRDLLIASGIAAAALLFNTACEAPVRPVEGPIKVEGDPDNLRIGATTNVNGNSMLGTRLRETGAYTQEAFNLQTAMRNAAVDLAEKSTAQWLGLRKAKNPIAFDPVNTVVDAKIKNGRIDQQIPAVQITHTHKGLDIAVTFGLTPDKSSADFSKLMGVRVRDGAERNPATSELSLNVLEDVTNSSNPVAVWKMLSTPGADNKWPRNIKLPANSDQEWQNAKAQIAAGLELLKYDS